MIIVFDSESSVSINSLAVSKNDNVKVATRFFSSEILSTSQQKPFIFQKKIIQIYSKYSIERTFSYRVLTDNDSTCLKFLIISNIKNNILDKIFREVLFDVIIANDIYGRPDTSHPYWEECNARKQQLQKCLEYCEIESIDNP